MFHLFPSMETILWEWKCNAICFFFPPQQPHLVVYHFRRQTLSDCLFWKSGVPNRNNLGALHQFTELSPSDPIKTRLRNRSYPALYPFYLPPFSFILRHFLFPECLSLNFQRMYSGFLQFPHQLWLSCIAITSCFDFFHLSYPIQIRCF